jgi:MinD-like ATPase involved in chromosome partitioning or flagellar assembly
MSAAKKHLDEARRGAVDAMKAVLKNEPAIAAAAIVDDLYGRISVTLWLHDRDAADRIREAVMGQIAEACGQFFSGTVSVSTAASPRGDDDLLRRAAWDEGVPVDGADRLRLNDRYRNHTSWFVGADPAAGEQCWSLEDGPPVVVFHGFKGGAGRTTLLVSYALACARRGRRVVVVDVDLDAPGIGVLLGADADGTTARWGTVDFLLESAQDLPLDDYFHVCAREKVTRAGRVEVFPAGIVDDDYLSKLGRVDLDVRTHVRNHALGKLLQRIREERTPDLILLDGRAGLSPAAGLLLSGIAHLHVLVATSNVQSLRGLERIVHHLGFKQARRNLPQRECIIVQAHVPDSADAAKAARSFFASRLETFFLDGYYSKDPDEDDRTWSLRDLESEVAPHVPVPISYRQLFAHFSAIDDVADQLLSDSDHVALHQRIDERLGVADEAAVNAEGEDGDG